MPQFDITFFPTQLFWLIICFVITFLALWKKGIPQLKETFQARSDKIEGQLKKAEEIRDQGKKIAQQIEDRLINARLEASELIQATTHEANKALTVGRNETVAALRIKVKEAEKVIVEQKAKAYPQVRTIAMDAAASMAAALASIKITPKQIEPILDDIKTTEEN